MELRTYKVFTFDELTDEQKQKAIQKLSDINVDDDYWFDIDEYYDGYILPRYKHINKVIDELYSDIDQAKSELEYGIFKKLQKQYDY